jgi:lysophospholipase L1-like esterase
MPLPVKSSALVLACCCLGAGFFSNPARLATTLTPVPVWETNDIGAVWSDQFDRSSLGTNWVVLGSVNAVTAANELQFVHTNTDTSRQVYYQPWLTSADEWTLHWSQRFVAQDVGTVGVGVGLKNFQEQSGGNDRGYNALLYGGGTNAGKMALQRWDGTNQNLVTLGPALTLAAGDIVDCGLTRSGWLLTASATNRANSQVSTASLMFSDFVTPRLADPSISRMCFYPFQGAVYVSNVSFVINHRKPARFIVVGASISVGWDATNNTPNNTRGFVAVIQSNFVQTVCNESSSYNATGDAVSLVPEILAHQPGTAILTIGANDLWFGYPAAQWQSNYSNLVVQLQNNGIKVKHCLPTPITPWDLRPLVNWISTTYPAKDVIDDWSALMVNGYQLNPAYDNYDNDGVHPNDAGHVLIGQIIRTNLR